MNDELVKNLKLCNSIEEIYSNLEQHRKTDSLVNDIFYNSILSIKINESIRNYHLKLKGVPLIAFRVLTYLKFSGYFDRIPQNSGKYKFISDLHSLLDYLCKDKIKLKYMDEINYLDLDSTINYYLNEQGYTVYHINSKIKKLTDWIKFANPLLPSFLKIDSSIFQYSGNYKILRKKYLAENKSEKSSNKIVYPLKDLKVIMQNSIKYINDYSEDILEVAFFLLKDKHLGSRKTNHNLYTFLEDNSFTEPRLKVLKEEIKNDKVKKHSYYRKSVFKELVNKLEISCISIILMMTGMRISELRGLKRDLKFTKDEFLGLTRLVYKTASSERGESLNMPIPDICKKALKVLLDLTYIKDTKKKYSSLLLCSIENIKNIKPIDENRANKLLKDYCEELRLSKAITTHQFRHSMAFIVSSLNKNDGLELAKMMLGHKSIEMTLEYMSHYNLILKETFNNYRKEESGILIDQIIDSGQKIFGSQASKFKPNNNFTGIYIEDFTRLLRKSLLNLIEKEQLSIIQTPVCLCIHDLSKVEELACQRGFNVADIHLLGPMPSRCKGAVCSNSIFLERHIEKIKNDTYQEIDETLKKRLEKNTYFMDVGGFEQNPYKKLIKEFDKYKKEIS